ncbi:MAG TPA: glycerophosphodiester phosphodiesterase [Thermoanaerobaculia bacterium]|nr:glycerophosphodiester phosphodiesterase [Thermoanaerobaculia bacterium]
MSDRFLVFGHRGSPRRFPENSVASFEEALRAGADGFETDLRLLSDNTAVLFHDDEWREAEIETLAADWIPQVGYELARVSDLAKFAGRGTMVLEVKRAKWEDVLLSEIAGLTNIIVASFDHTLIAELARRHVEFPLGLTVFGRLVNTAESMKRLGATWLFPQFRYVDRELVESLHAEGISVVPWTPNRERDWQRLHDAGCDGIITDYPGEAVEWRNRMHTF